MKDISIIIPAYNESKRIGATLEAIIRYMDGGTMTYEILVVDDGSTDGTASYVRERFPAVSVLGSEKNSGKGAAVRKGLLAAQGRLRLFSDADLSTPIAELRKLLAFVEEGYDVVIGSRALQKELIKDHQPFYREFMGKIFNKIVQAAVLSGISDTQCGFKIFTAEAAGIILPMAKINGFSFDVELLYLARKKGLKIKEVAVEWYNDDRSTVDPLKDSLRMLAEIFRIRKLHK